jgi:hypothetical protein
MLTRAADSKPAGAGPRRCASFVGTFWTEEEKEEILRLESVGGASVFVLLNVFSS